jgi:ABC-type Fe3+ transport system substrate-binding protein
MQRLSRFIALGYIAICLLTLAGTAVIGPLGYAPFRLVRGPERPPIVVTIWYGTEKKEWLEAAQTRFAATNPSYAGRPIQIQLRGMGSREMAERAAQQSWGDDTPPTALSPASGFWLDMAGVPLAETPRPLVLSPLVVVGWEDRARALWPDGPHDLWRELHDAIANPSGWKALGGQEQWGPVKLGHTRPLASNSGAQALLLMAYGFHHKTSGLSPADVNSPEFQRWLKEIEGDARVFGDNSGDFMGDFVRSGAAKYDFGVIYENLAIESMDAARSRQGQPLRVFYPPATLLSEHPFATLKGDWVTPEQRAAAAQFRDFLLSRPIQELAVQHGFRPTDTGVSIESNAADNPFARYQQNGVRAALAGTADVPPAEVINALLELWRTQIGK